MDRDGALEVQRRAFGDFLAMLAAASEGARLLELDGVTASVVPATPRRSVPNSVTYTDLSSLEAAYDQVAAAYDDAGVNAWTVWAADFDPPAVELLAGRGHVFDGEPAAMVLDLGEMGDPDLEDLDWDAGAEITTLGAINDAAYGHEGADGYARALTRLPERLRLYQARADGDVASVLGTIDHAPVAGAPGPDCGIYFVATLPQQRGQGLSKRLLYAALLEAHERGCATSSLQASKMGEPVYLRMGYRPYFRFHMYERRRGR